MYNEEVEYLRKELLKINFEIAQIEKNHHLEGKEKEMAYERLERLKTIQEDIRFRLRHSMYENISSQSRGGRR